MIFSGANLSILAALTGPLPVLAGIALAIMWWLDDELGDPVGSPDPAGPVEPVEPVERAERPGRVVRPERVERRERVGT